MPPLTTLPRPVIRARCAHATDARMESFRGLPVLTGLVRRADSATTGSSAVMARLTVSASWGRYPKDDHLGARDSRLPAGGVPGKLAHHRARSPSGPLTGLELALWSARLPVLALLQPGLDGRADRVARHPHVGQVGRVVQECLVPRPLAREGIQELALAPIGLVVNQAQQSGRSIGKYSHGRPPLNWRGAWQLRGPRLAAAGRRPASG